MADARIFIVEDDRQLAVELQNYLIKIGYDVDIFPRDFETVFLATQKKMPSILLLGTSLPYWNARSDPIRQDLRQRTRTWRIPILYMGHHADFDDQIYCLELFDFEEFIEKPVNMGQLALSIRRLIDYAKRIELYTVTFGPGGLPSINRVREYLSHLLKVIKTTNWVYLDLDISNFDKFGATDTSEFLEYIVLLIDEAIIDSQGNEAITGLSAPGNFHVVAVVPNPKSFLELLLIRLRDDMKPRLLGNQLHRGIVWGTEGTFGNAQEIIDLAVKRRKGCERFV